MALRLKIIFNFIALFKISYAISMMFSFLFISIIIKSVFILNIVRNIYLMRGI